VPPWPPLWAGLKEEWFFADIEIRGRERLLGAVEEMFAAIGIVVVLVAVIGGFLVEKGNLSVLIQPAEVLIIFGSALGSLIISSHGKMLGLIMGNLARIFSAKATSRETYLELLLLLYQLFTKVRKQGLLSIEGDVENPEKSEVFSRFPAILADKAVLNFICDNFRVIVSTNMPPHELEALLDIDIEAQQHEALLPSTAVAKVADALPGLGIVAAVLGVVLTMGKISEPPEVLGHSIGAALVGTFLGVLSCYGFVGPLATRLEHIAKDREVVLQVIKTALVAFVGDAAPRIAVESGRRAIPNGERPTFLELEEAIKKWKQKT
jgi:chemotaxis protein MotA